MSPSTSSTHHKMPQANQNQTIDTPPNYHLYSLDNLMSIRTGEYSVQRESMLPSDEEGDEISYDQADTINKDSSSAAHSKSPHGNSASQPQSRTHPDSFSSTSHVKSHNNSPSSSQNNLQLPQNHSMNINRDFMDLSATTSTTAEEQQKIGFEEALKRQHSNISSSAAADASNPPRSPSMLSDDVFSSLESSSTTPASSSKPTTKLLTKQKLKSTPQLNYDEHHTPNTDSDSDYFTYDGTHIGSSHQQQQHNARKNILRKRRKRHQHPHTTRDNNRSADEDSGSNTSADSPDASSRFSPHHHHKKKRSSRSTHRVTIKQVCNGAPNAGGFHIIAIYCSNDVLILRFEVRDSIELSEDYYAGGSLLKTSVATTDGNSETSSGASSQSGSGGASSFSSHAGATSAFASSLLAGATGLTKNPSSEHLMGMGRYSDAEDDDNASIVTGFTSLNSSSNLFHGSNSKYSQRELDILYYRKLLHQYQSISQEQWDNYVNRGTPIPGGFSPPPNPSNLSNTGPTATTSSTNLTMPTPIVRTISYFRDNNISIDEMIMDDKFLICIDRTSPDGDVYVLPLCRLIFPFMEDNVWPFRVHKRRAATPSQPVAAREHQNDGEDDAVSSSSIYSSPQSRLSFGNPSAQQHAHHPDDIPSLLEYTRFISESSKAHSQENLLASLSCITKISHKKRLFNSKKFGTITCTCLWKTFLNKHYLVMGTNRGYLLFLNLHTQQEECEFTIPGTSHAAIHRMHLVSDPKQEYKYLALTLTLYPNQKNRSSRANLLPSLGNSGSSSNLLAGASSSSSGGAGSNHSGGKQQFFYKQILEHKDPSLHTYKTICEYKQYAQLSANDSTAQNMNSKYDTMVFTPVPLLEGEEYQSTHGTQNGTLSSTDSSSSMYYSLSVYEDPQKGPMLCLFNKLDNRLSLFDPLSTRFPLYIFQLNADASLFHVTENLLFTVQKSSDLTPQPEHIWIISRLFANASKGGVYSLSTPNWTHGQHRSTKTDSVFQDFQLPPKQRICGILPAHHWKRQQQAISQQDSDRESVDAEDQSASHLDGCIVWSQNAIYELKQAHTPTHIFRQLLRHPSGLVGEKSDRFAKTFKLDIFKLYEQEADRAYRHSNFDKAFKLYEYSYIPEAKKVSKLMQSHRIDDVLNYLKGLLSNPQSLPLNKKQELSNLLFSAYLFKLNMTNSSSAAEESPPTDSDELTKSPASAKLQPETPTSPSSVRSRKRLSSFSKQMESTTRLRSNSDSAFLERGIGSRCEVPAVDPVIWKQFRKFLLDSHDYNAENAVHRLIDSGMIAMALEVAKHAQIVPLTLKYLVHERYVSLSTECMDFLFQNSFAADVVSIGEGIFLHSSTPDVQVKFLLEYIKKSRLELVKALRQHQYPTLEEHHLFTQEELLSVRRLIQSSSDALQNVSQRFTRLLHYVGEEMVLLEIAQTFNPAKSLFASFDSFGFSQSSTVIPEEVRRRQYENRHTLYYFPHFTLQMHTELFLVAMIRLAARKQSVNRRHFSEGTQSIKQVRNRIASTASEQKKVSDASPGSFSHAFLYRHTQEKLEYNMQLCAHLYRAQRILSVCQKYRNIDALCAVYEMNDMWSESLSCRLSQLQSRFSNKSNEDATTTQEELMQHIFQLFEKYILLQRPQHHHKGSIQTKALLILKIFDFWKRHVDSAANHLAQLENLCMNHMESIGSSLSYLLLLPDSREAEADTPAIPPQYQKYRSSHPLVLPFGHHFMLEITKHHTNSMKKSRHEKQTSISNLQNQILRNMEKDLLDKERSYIVVPNLTLREHDEWFVFTCSHLYSKKQFVKMISEFYQKTKELIETISQAKDANMEIESIIISVHFIEQEYRTHMRCGSGVSRQSCAICIYNYFCNRLVKKGLLSSSQSKKRLWSAPAENTMEEADQYLSR